jgi:hypothetical protein
VTLRLAIYNIIDNQIALEIFFLTQRRRRRFPGPRRQAPLARPHRVDCTVGRVEGGGAVQGAGQAMTTLRKKENFKGNLIIVCILEVHQS